jgi:hypothetical protein
MVQPSVARSVTGNLASSATTAGELHSVQRSALTASRLVGRTTADGYVDLKPLPDDGYASTMGQFLKLKQKKAAQ